MSGSADLDEEQRRREAEKIDLEIRKMRQDMSIGSRIAAIIIPIALAVIGVAQTYLALSDMRSKDVREVRDLELKQIENGMRLVEFATAESKRVTSTDRDEAKQAVTYVSTLLPPDMACQMLNAVVLGVRVADDLSEYAASMRTQIAQATSPAPLACTASPRDRQDQAIIAIASQNPKPQPAGAAAPPACPAPPAHGDVALVVYYQIVRREDRAIASTIGFQMPAQFPSAGIEYVNVANPTKGKADVRYYHAEQKADAEYLACLLTAAYADAVHGTTVQFRAFSLADLYKGLPAKRVEVWFPPING